ncbi:MAG: ABC transporter permease subunit [Phycisphaerales bacterium]|nr:ABC transporter permease subunit [Phycisphaerales bacterium]
MPSQLLTIARNTFVESVRQPIYFILLAICGIAQILTTWGTGFSMGYTESGEVSGDDKMLLEIGLATVFVCGMLLAAFIATAVVSREIENKTVLTVVSKPVSRPVLIVGKYLGVSGAMVIAVLTMLLFLQLSLRHQVLSNASDQVDKPVVLFSFLATFFAFGIAIWCNFFYGWVFSQTATLLMFPLFTAAWVGTLLLSKDWHFQPIATDFKPQVALISLSVLMALLVLTAVATAASTRLGQVMTIVVCAGVFLLGLLSNHFIGRHAHSNRYAAVIHSAEPQREGETSFNQPGDTYDIALRYAPREPITVGTPFYYGPNPNGVPLNINPYKPFKGDTSDRMAMFDNNREPALVVVEAENVRLTVKHVGPAADLAVLPPRNGDYVFIRPTFVNPVAVTLWGVIPNVQFFWLVDAVTQANPVPARHILLVAAYGAVQIIVFLSLAIILFQRREVG